MNTTALINTDTNRAYRTLITTPELDEQFESINAQYPMPTAPTSKDIKAATKCALNQMFGIHTIARRK